MEADRPPDSSAQQGFALVIPLNSIVFLHILIGLVTSETSLLFIRTSQNKQSDLSSFWTFGREVPLGIPTESWPPPERVLGS